MATIGQAGEHAVMSLEEVARIMESRGFPMSKQAVRYFEQNAFKKLRRDPEVLRVWTELTAQPGR